jgi:hypothetical protein
MPDPSDVLADIAAARDRHYDYADQIGTGDDDE